MAHSEAAGMPATGAADNDRLNRREFADGLTRLESLPTRAWLSVTGKCNLLCTHCPRSLVDEQYLSSDEMQPAVFERVKQDVFPALEQLRIGGNNLGEQLFARTWNTYAPDMGDGAFTPWIITNAQTMNQARIKELVERGYIIDISIDAASDVKYRQIRGASLAKLVENVRSIVSERNRLDAIAPAGRRRAKVIFSFTAFADNIDELPALVRLGAELGIDEVVVTHYMPSLEDQRLQSLFYHQTSANRVFEEASRIARDAGLALQVPPSYPVAPLGQTDSLRLKVKDRYGRDVRAVALQPEASRCRHPWTSVSINEKGEVYPCCQSNLLMGDLNKSSFAEIWNNRRYQKLRATVNTDRAPLDCQQCVLRGATFTSVACSEGHYFLRNLDLAKPHLSGWHARGRDWFARTRLGRWLWNQCRLAYKNVFEWHWAR